MCVFVCVTGCCDGCCMTCVLQREPNQDCPAPRGLLAKDRQAANLHHIASMRPRFPGLHVHGVDSHLRSVHGYEFDLLDHVQS